MRFLPYAAIVAPSILPRSHGFRELSLSSPKRVTTVKSPSFQLLSSLPEEYLTRSAPEEQPQPYATRTAPTSANPPAGGNNNISIEMAERTQRTTGVKPPPQSAMSVNTEGARDKAYNAILAKLATFKQTHGHCNVPQKYSKDPSLGKWVNTQRHAYKTKQKGLHSSITNERVAALNRLGFDWDPSKSRYDAYLVKLAAFKQKHGHSNVPEKHAVDPSLGEWVNNQRANYQKLLKGLPTQMTDDRVAALDKLSFDWDLEESTFDANLAKLVIFKQKHGHCNVPTKYAEDPSLRRWVNNQRVVYKKKQNGSPGQITDERVAALNKLSFDWDLSKSTYDAYLAKLTTFRQKHGHCNVPKKYAGDPSLGEWVNNQRAHYQKKQKGLPSQITDERVEALNKLSFDWDLGKLSYDANLAKLATFKRKHGHCKVPRKYADDPSLGIWVNNQRVLYNKKQKGLPSQITDERVEALNELGFDWDLGKSAYTANLAKLATFKQKHGHCNVPMKYAEDPSLGVWVNNQRANYKKQQKGLPSQITNERVAALNKLSFDWKYKNEKTL